MLDDEALEVLCDIFEVIEACGTLPSQVQALLFVLLPKPKGGMRPIALFRSLFRLWSRVRRSEAAE
eukprot:9738258-Heterocapsa_arctica.AAC.1